MKLKWLGGLRQMSFGFVALIGVCAILIVTAGRANAQGTEFSLGLGVISPVAPSSPFLTRGGQVSVGVGRVVRSNLTVGIEASYTAFGNHAVPQVPDKFSLANYYLTGRYNLGHATLHPFIGVAAGVSQKHLGDATMSGHWGELSGSGRVNVGIERGKDGMRWALDVGYATVDGLTYRNRLIRYVPVTLHLIF